MNFLHPAWDGEVRLADGTTARAVRLGRHVGARRLGATLYELDPGAAASPLHFHHGNEELLFVLIGTPTLRFGEGRERDLEAGEVVSFLPGRDGTHQVLNQSSERVRVIICATNDLPEVAEQVETGLLVLLTEEGATLVPADATQELRQAE